jgi:hypothetical protein
MNTVHTYTALCVLRPCGALDTMSRRPRDADSDDSDIEVSAEQDAGAEAISCDILEAVARSISEDPEFSRPLNVWVYANCDKILESDEHSLEATELHEEFKAYYEKQIEALIISRGSSVVDFYKKLQESQEKPVAKSSAALIGQIFMATLDFDTFVAMMRQTSASLRHHK